MRWGLLSTARINALVIAGARDSDAVELVAVAGRDGERTAAYAREHEIPRAHAGYDALLADPEVEAVYISLPNSMHVDWAVRALQAGKHVLCEKPLSRRAAEAERAFDAAQAAGRLLMEAFMWRHNPQTLRFADELRGGTIGELRLVRAAFSFPLADAGDPRLSAELEGGALMDVGCYCVSGARLLAGEPELVSAQQVTTADGVDRRMAGTMRHRGGVLTTFDCALDLPARSELQAIGSEGVLSADDPWHCRAERFELRRDTVQTISVEPADSYRLELENLSAAIRGTAAPLLGREDAVAQARVIEALYVSADAGGAPTPV
ncbi:MAG TPA: Gfo/Idh/MocA family oxidoreductase [Solirubrobacteraceae bacterium]|nr:Gfo/Idh/MocA family oxidoreductase [Solirubrobacteraceae bacterium]